MSNRLRNLPELVNRRTIHNLGRVVRLVWQTSPRHMIASALLILIQGLWPLLLLYLFKRFVDAVTLAVGRPESAAAESVFWLIGALVLANGLQLLFGGLTALVRERQSMEMTDLITSQIHAKTVSMDLAFFENPDYNNTLHLVLQESPSRPTQVVQNLMQLGQQSITMVAMLGLLWSLHWFLLPLLIIGAIPGVALNFYHAHRLYRRRQQWVPLERQANYYGWMITTAFAAKEIRLLLTGDLFRERYQQARKQLRVEKLDFSRQQALADNLAQWLAVAIVLVALGFIARQTIAGAITLGGMVMYYQALQRGQASVRGILSSGVRLFEDSLFIGHLYAFLDLKPQIAAPRSRKPVPVPWRQGIRLENVCFRYSGKQENALTDIDLTIAPGEHIALVGVNGSGKSTLIKVICRLYEIQNGRIALDGIDIREFDPADWWRQFSILFQDMVHYQNSVADNIWFGDIRRTNSNGHIEEAARLAGVDRLIEKLPQGYQTHLGRMLADGAELSSGEWQKIGVARALYRDAQMVILDEPTSALDAAAEQQIIQNFLRLARGKSAIFISHRLSMARRADRIVVLDQGRVVQQGDHHTLMAEGGEYARLFNLQAGNYIH